MRNMTNKYRTANDLVRIQQIENFYASFLKYVKCIFANVTSRDALDIRPIAGWIKMLCDIVRNDCCFLMRAMFHAKHTDDENYLFSHMARATIVAMNIGTYLKLPNHRLIELGIATLLHDIGMLTLPPELYLNDQALTEAGKKLINYHPIQSSKLLQSCNYPPLINTAVREHHEREDASGYPLNLSGDKISLYAKIIAVACSYEALSAKRPHKEAKEHYRGILELLKNEGKRYDGRVIRALVYSLSIYPIGQRVLLSDGRKGEVIDINPQDPRYPVVQIFEDIQSNKDKKIIIQTSSKSLSIVQPLSGEEVMAQ